MNRDKKRFNVDELIKNVNIQMGLTLGTLKNVNAFPENITSKIKDLISLLKKDRTLPIDEGITLLKDGDILLNDVEACLKELEKEEMLTEEWESIIKTPYFISYTIKKYALLPLLLNWKDRDEIKYKIDELPDENLFKFTFLECVEDDRDRLFDGMLLLKEDILNTGKMTEKELNEVLEEIAYEESKLLEKAEGNKDEATPTERQKRYVRLRMGHDK